MSSLHRGLWKGKGAPWTSCVQAQGLVCAALRPGDKETQSHPRDPRWRASPAERTRRLETDGAQASRRHQGVARPAIKFHGRRVGGH